MKKQIKSLLVLSVLSIFSLTGCDMLKNIANLGDDSGDNNEEKGENLPYTQEQAKNKLLELGQTSGFEITYHAFDEDEKEVDNYTFGMKGNVVWQYDNDDKQAIKKDDNGLSIYEYSAETQKYELTYTYTEADAISTYDEYVSSYSLMFFFANTYDGMDGYHRVKDTTFAGRAAIEYRYDLTVITGEVHLTTVIDKEVGITLFWDANGKSYTDGESGSATFEVTSFKTGNQVNAPELA